MTEIKTEQTSIKTCENLQSETAKPNKKKPESQYYFYKHWFCISFLGAGGEGKEVKFSFSWQNWQENNLSTEEV